MPRKRKERSKNGYIGEEFEKQIHLLHIFAKRWFSYLVKDFFK